MFPDLKNRKMDIKHSIKQIEWEAVAGIIAAVLALILHFLHIIEEGVLIMITLILISLLFLRDLRREQKTEEITSVIKRTEDKVSNIQNTLPGPNVELIGPESLRSESSKFGRNTSGDMIWFHVCLLMFRPQGLFDTLLKPAIENPNVNSIQFILDESEKQSWEKYVKPKINKCNGKESVKKPIWCNIDENISFILAEHESEPSEALLSFWGEPFMSKTTEREVPRYIFRVHERSELLIRFREIERSYRFQ